MIKLLRCCDLAYSQLENIMLLWAISTVGQAPACRLCVTEKTMLNACNAQLSRTASVYLSILRLMVPWTSEPLSG